MLSRPCSLTEFWCGVIPWFRSCNVTVFESMVLIMHWTMVSFTQSHLKFRHTTRSKPWPHPSSRFAAAAAAAHAARGAWGLTGMGQYQHGCSNGMGQCLRIILYFHGLAIPFPHAYGHITWRWTTAIIDDSHGWTGLPWHASLQLSQSIKMTAEWSWLIEDRVIAVTAECGCISSPLLTRSGDKINSCILETC